MTPTQIRAKVVADRVAWIREMVEGMRSLPLESFQAFSAHPRDPAAAESYLRRALEALLDLGRHVAARGFGRAVTEYKEVGDAMVELEILDPDAGTLLRRLAGYRNRLVHFYDEVSKQELYEICAGKTGDIEAVLEALLNWLRKHPEKVDSRL